MNLKQNNKKPQKSPNGNGFSTNVSSKTEKKFSTKGLDIFITIVLSLIFILCPLFFTGFVMQGVGFEKMMLFYFLVLLGLIAWVTKGVIQGELTLMRTPLDIPNIILLIAISISTILSVNTKDSLMGAYGQPSKSFIALIIFVLFYYLLVNNITAKRIKIFFWSIIISSSLLIIYSFLQICSLYILPFSFSHFQSFNPVGSLSGLTMAIIIFLPLLVIATAKVQAIAPNLSKNKIIALKIVFGLVILLGIGSLALLNGYTFWPAAIVSIVILLMFFLSKIVGISNSNLAIPLVVFLLLIIFLVLGNFSFVNLNLPTEVNLSRQASWEITKNSLKDNPVLGSGPSTYYYNFSKYKTDNFNNSPLWNIRFDTPAGGIFELISTTGVLGTAVIIIIILIALSVYFLSLIRSHNRETSPILLGLFSSFITILILFAAFPQTTSLILMSLIISIFGLGVSYFIAAENQKLIKLSLKANPKYALALAAIFLFAISGVAVLFTIGAKIYLADIHAGQAALTPDNNKKITNMEKAISLSPYQEVYYLNLANLYLGLANQAAIDKKEQQEIGDYLNKAIALGKKAYDIAPNKAAVNEALAMIYENSALYTKGASLEWAEKYYNNEMELEPANPIPNLKIGMLNISRANIESDEKEKKNNIDEAIKKYDEAINKKKDFAAAYYAKGIANEIQGNVDNAVKELANAVLASGGPNAPDNNDYKFELGRLLFNRGVNQQTLKQTASDKITESEISSTSASSTEEISGESAVENKGEINVESAPIKKGSIKRNNDINDAELIFIGILNNNPKNADGWYSLAVLYDTIGEKDKKKIAVDELMKILPDGQVKETIKSQFAGQ